jgi:hypothetical protein
MNTEDMHAMTSLADQWLSTPIPGELPIAAAPTLQAQQSFLGQLWDSFSSPFVATGKAIVEQIPATAKVVTESLHNRVLQELGLAPKPSADQRVVRVDYNPVSPPVTTGTPISAQLPQVVERLLYGGEQKGDGAKSEPITSKNILTWAGILIAILLVIKLLKR